MSQPPGPQNVSLFGSRVIAGVISEDEVPRKQDEPLARCAWRFYKKRRHRATLRETLRDEADRMQGGQQLQGWWRLPGTGEEAGKDSFSFTSLEGIWPADTLISDL